MSRSKTREQKIRAGYRLQNFRLHAVEKQQERDSNEFGYLSSHYVVKDLTKTFIFSLVIIALLIAAKIYLA